MFTSPFQVQQERKTAEKLASRSGLPYSAGFVGELAGKRVGHGNCGPNPQTAGHLGCLEFRFLDICSDTCARGERANWGGANMRIVRGGQLGSIAFPATKTTGGVILVQT